MMEHVDQPTEYSASCPSMVPFVVAFCAEDLKCMDADKAGEGRPGHAWTFKGNGDNCGMIDNYI